MLLLAVALLGCVPSAAQRAPSSSVADPAASISQAPPAKKRITVAVRGDTPLLWGGDGAVGEWIIDLFMSAPINFEPSGAPNALLAEQVPSLENGLWKLLPDGRMETTITLRPGARWHDGTPMTSEDLIFGATVGREFPDLQLSVNFGSALYADLEKLEATDERTVVASWRRPSSRADWLFSYLFAPPLPKHLLEPSYLADKASFTNLRFWSTEFVGSGPFMVRDFNPGISLELTAYPEYVHGRPKLDEVEVRYIPDQNTLIANVLAGSVDLTLGQGLSIEQALRTQEGWPAGTVIYSPYFLTQAVGYPQFVNPEPAVLGNLQMRRALAHATDRDGLVEAIQAGVGQKSSALIAPTGPEFEAIKARVVEYDYDPRRASQLIEGLGYSKSADGMYRDDSGQPLTVQLWASADDDVYERTTLAVANGWRTFGVATESRMVPRSAERSVMPSRPGFQMGPLRTEVDTRFLSTEVPLPENNFRGANRARYGNPEFDRLLQRYFTTVPIPERNAVLGEIVNHMTANLVVIHLFYNAVPQMVNKRLQNVTPRTSRTNAWTPHLWDVN